MGLLDKLMGKGDDKDKKKADFSDVRAGGSSTAPAARPNFGDVQSGGGAGAAAGAAHGKTYTVVSGDSLSKIAKREYGDAGKWRAIFEANKDKISNPDLIQPGQVLTLPRDA